jgi:FtsH-binding integral membrane protein
MGMFDNQNPYAATYNDLSAPPYAYLAEESARTTFIRRTYLHLAGAVALFVAIEALVFSVVPAEVLDSMLRTMLGNRYSWLIVLGAFMGVSWLARSWANSSTSQGMQYAGLFLYVLAEAVIFVPLLYVAQMLGGDVIASAGLLTLLVFGGLTAFVFVTKADLGWLGKYLFWAGLLAFGAIICMMFLNVTGMGLLFTVAMIGLASGYILYDTSNIMHHYRTDQHVAASLALFASVALLFWYILQLLMRLQSRD